MGKTEADPEWSSDLSHKTVFLSQAASRNSKHAAWFIIYLLVFHSASSWKLGSSVT